MSDITLRRVGAIGDAVWATSLFHVLSERAKAQGGGLYFSTAAPHGLFASDPLLSGVIEKDHLRGELIDLTDVYESRPTVHPVYAYADAAGVERADVRPLRVCSGLPVKPEVVYVHPAVSWENRTLPRSFWFVVLDALRSAGKTPVVVGTRAEVAPFVKFSTLTCDLVQFARYIRNGVFLGSDSGPLQIAAAVGVPCVGLYTCAVSRYRAPVQPLQPFVSIDAGSDCIGCLHRAPAPVRFIDCDQPTAWRHRCLQAFDPVQVAVAVVTLFDEAQ